ncbi:MAG: peptidoglycan DD-metalloendopeptidase family protein, partial [Arenimonas sp.]
MLKRTCLVIAGFLLLGSAIAGDVYRWVDKNGQVHFEDRAPQQVASKVTRHSVDEREPDEIVVLEIVDRSNGWDVYVRNLVYGPVEVELSFHKNKAVQAKPGLPLQRVLNARERALLTRIDAIGPNAEMGIKMEGAPGGRSGLPKDFLYQLPIDKKTAVRIAQAFNGRYTHNDEQNRFAVDFAMPVGTPILAARSGIVMQTTGTFDRAGTQKEKYATRANNIRILHEDGSMAVYAHLKQKGIMVREGQRVSVGQLIG